MNKTSNRQYTIGEKKTEKGGMGKGGDTIMHYNLLGPENIYLLKMLGGFFFRKGREGWKSSPLFNHFSLVWGGNTQTDMFETSQRNQTLPFCSWPQGYKLVGQVQFMLLVIQKGG